MSGKSVNFDDEKIKKSEYSKNKKVSSVDYIDVNKILLFKKRAIWHKKFG